MASLKVDRSLENASKFFVIPFFCIHYGGFCAIHGFFLMTFFKIGSGASFLDNGTWWGPLLFLQLLFSVIATLWESKPPEMIWALIGLFISHGISFMENYIMGREYKATTLKKLMNQPYRRIVVMHIAILAGGFFVLMLDSPMPLLIILVLLKIFFDLHLHSKSHKTFEKQEKEESEENSVPEKIGLSD